ncbi:MAG: chemotaxis protein CheA [Acidobacteria bacterium]|nr:chemotaxis protein CheA [Acidobacteriota bacterium]
MDMSRYLDLFVSEARQHLMEAEREIARLAAGESDAEGLNALYRHFHSLKGMAASMGFAPIATLSHKVEDLFDEIRKDPAARAGRPGVADLVVAALDVIASMVETVAGGGHDLPGTEDLAASVARATVAMAGESAPSPAPGAERAPGGIAGAAAPAPDGDDGATVFRCRLQINPDAELPAARAALALRQLDSVGSILTSTPARETLGHAPFDGSIALLLSTKLPRAKIVAAIEGILDVASYSLNEELLPVEPAARREGPRESEAGLPSTIRIPTHSLDRFLDTLGELITWRGSLGAALKGKDLHTATESHGKLAGAIDRLRADVMEIRLLPFEHIAPHLNQTVRALARQTGKRVALQVSGMEVALDRAVLEEILDPLNHMLRNAVDHGIEPAEEREAHGKDSTGRIFIAVSREGDRVRLKIEDDGRGIDPDEILKSAIDGGFISVADAAALTPADVLLLTTIPGFSTTERPNELSGRGVGMDVVRTRIEKLGGHMDLRTQKGSGVTILLDLPLTVAVIDAFLVEVGGTIFAVPGSVAYRTMLASRDLVRRSRGGFFLDEGGTLLHAFRPDDALGLQPDGRELPERFPVLLFRTEAVHGALAVDSILERRELVVKPLGPPLEHLREYSGAALLDDGRIALILDVPNLHRQVTGS